MSNCKICGQAETWKMKMTCDDCVKKKIGNFIPRVEVEELIDIYEKYLKKAHSGKAPRPFGIMESTGYCNAVDDVIEDLKKLLEGKDDTKI